MRVRLPVYADLRLFAVGAAATLAAVLFALQTGTTVGLGSLVALALFCLVVVGFIAFPHVVVAAMIPLFVLIPALKLFATPAIGPVKDAVSFAAITATAILLVQRASEGRTQRGDFWIAAAVVFLIGLYVLNLGGGMQRGVAWVQGLRLISEPILLLLVGLSLPHARRTLRWGLASLTVTACFIACIGLLQQAVGGPRLIELGYSYTLQVTYIGDRLRSFGTMDDPFTYAAFLLLGLVGVMMWMRRGVLAVLAGTLIVGGIAVAYVRTSLVVMIAILGLWLARSQRPTIAAFVLALAATSAGTILIASSEGTQSQTTRAGPSLFLTINGRTDGWKIVLDDPKTWAVGKGVGQVGTAAERATYSISRRQRDVDKASAVDSGYFALIADVGFLGLVVFLGLVGRTITLARSAIARGAAAGWIAVGLITVIILDATTRDSFTGFPTAFIAMLLVGVALAAAAESAEEGPAAKSARAP